MWSIRYSLERVSNQYSSINPNSNSVKKLCHLDVVAQKKRSEYINCEQTNWYFQLSFCFVSFNVCVFYSPCQLGNMTNEREFSRSNRMFVCFFWGYDFFLCHWHNMCTMENKMLARQAYTMNVSHWFKNRIQSKSQSQSQSFLLL